MSTINTTGQVTGALERAAALTLAAKADLDLQVQRLSAEVAQETARWEGSGARAFATAYAGWAEQQQRILLSLQWFHDQLRAIEALNAATDADAARTFGGAA